MQELLSKNAGSLTENLITVRNDRQVLPVRADSKNKIAGVVHDMSASGQTLYIEPNAAVSLNNNLNQKKIEEKMKCFEFFEQSVKNLNPTVWIFGKMHGYKVIST